MLKELKRQLKVCLASNNQIQTLISNAYSKKYGGKKEKQIQKRESWGEDFPDKTFYVIRRYHNWGLMSIVTMYIRDIIYARRRGCLVVVDMCNVHSLYLEDEQIGKENAWEWYFQQPDGYTLNDIKKAKNVILSPSMIFAVGPEDYCVEWECIEDGARSQQCRALAHETIRLQPEVEAHIEDAARRIFGKYFGRGGVLGVYCRGTDYTDLHPKGHPIQPPPDAVIAKAQEMMRRHGLQACYLVTEDERVADLFRNAFGERLLYDTKAWRTGAPRSSSDYMLNRMEGVDRKKNGLDYLTNMMLLSYCDCMIGGLTGGTAGFMLLNQKKFKETYIWNLGKYE